MEIFPERKFNLLKFLDIAKHIAFCVFSIVFSVIVFSCSDSSPAISKVDAKVVFDYQDSESTPVQKLSVFLEMQSDVRRIDSMNIYNSETGYRWIISSPVITEDNRKYFAGYPNCLVPSQSKKIIPSGKYDVFYIDSQGREAFTNFVLNYDSMISKRKFRSNIELIEFKDFKKNSAVYSKEGFLLYYGRPKDKWEVSQDGLTCNFSKISEDYKDAENFRLIYEGTGIVYIFPEYHKD